MNSAGTITTTDTTETKRDKLQFGIKIKMMSATMEYPMNNLSKNINNIGFKL